MSKKSFNHIEQIIKNASEANQPAFEEQAWKKMEALLNKEDDRAKPIVWFKWIWPALLVTSLLCYWFLTRPGRNKTKIVSQIQSTVTPAKTKQGVDLLIDSKTKNTKHPQTNQLLLPQPVGHSFKPAQQHQMTAKKKLVTPAFVNRIYSQTTGNPGHKNYTVTESMPGTLLLVKPGTTEAGNQITQVFTDKNSLLKVEQNKDESSLVEKIAVTIIIEKMVDKPPVFNADSCITKANPTLKTKGSKFYFLANAGIEKSGVTILSSGKSTWRTGVGIGYQLSKKLSIQSGFYSSDKKYSSGPGDYKTKPGSYWSMVAITRVDAECRVYEIPLLLRYDLRQQTKTTYFVAAGLSSYLMKKEDYQYYYKRNGAAYNAKANYTGNKHLFAALRISVGAEKKISHNIFINAMPGLALPLSGIGDGSVKLYSLDFSAGVKFIPSAKR